MKSIEERKEYQRLYDIKRRDKKKEYYQKNKDKIKNRVKSNHRIEYEKQYRLNNKEKIKQYRINNKEKIKENNKIRYIKNIDKNKELRKIYNMNNKEKINTSRKRYATKNKNQIRNNHIKSRYGITLEQYNEMFKLQEEKCLICNKHQNEFNKAFAIDHDHKTGKIRGLLCHKCNSGLGSFNDSIETLQHAIDYLKNNL